MSLRWSLFYAWSKWRPKLRRVRCWFRGYHIGDAEGRYKFRYDVHGMCFDCGKVGSGEPWTGGE